MDQQEYQMMSPAHKKQLQDSFGFLGELGVNNIAGTDYLTKDGVPLNALTKMGETQFVQEWLFQFALNNNTTNNNYFNFPKWGEISNQHTMCVMVTKDDDPNDTLFVVKPLSSYELTAQERDILNQAQGAFISSITATMEGQVPQLSSDDIVGETKKYLTSESHTPIQNLIPRDFYIKHGVYLDSLRKCFWLRDEYFKGQVSKEVMYKVKEIFDKEEKDNSATLEEYQWIKSICPDFNIPVELIGTDKKGQVIFNDNDDNTSIDPMSC